MPVPRPAHRPAPNQREPSANRGVTVSNFGNLFSMGRNVTLDEEPEPTSPVEQAQALAASQQRAQEAETTTVAERLAASDPVFVTYLRRVRDSDRVFVSTKRQYLHEAARSLAAMQQVAADADEVNLVPPAEDVDGRVVALRWTHPRWPDLVAREYLEKKRRFANRTQSTAGRTKSLVPALVVIGVLLYMLWPVWNVLIDLETDTYYKTLGVTGSATPTEIKRAYRTMAKKWHPDSNPGCGEMCQLKMIEIQKAHDVLLARGGKDTRGELKQKYDAAIGQVLAFVFYRGFAMAFNAVTFCNYFISLPRSVCPGSVEQLVHTVVRVAIIAAFIVCTTVYVTGFDVVLLLVTGFRLMSHWKEDAQLQKDTRDAFDDSTPKNRRMVRALTMSNFDLPLNALLFVVPALVVHLGSVWWSGELYVPSQLAFKAFYGTIFIAAAMIHMPPNLFDNLRMMEVTVPFPYFSQQVQQNGRVNIAVTLQSFVMAELGFLADDVFAFSSGIPAPYRVASYVAHALFLTQLVTLPWATPAALSQAKQIKVHKRLAAKRAAVEAAAESGKAAATTGGSYFDSVGALARMLHDDGTAASSDETASRASSPGATATGTDGRPRRERMTARHRELLKGLDTELTAWSDICGAAAHALSASPDAQRASREIIGAETAQPNGYAGVTHAANNAAMEGLVARWRPAQLRWWTVIGTVCALLAAATYACSLSSVPVMEDVSQHALLRYRNPMHVPGTRDPYQADAASTRGVAYGHSTDRSSPLADFAVAPDVEDVAAMMNAQRAQQPRRSRRGEQQKRRRQGRREEHA